MKIQYLALALLTVAIAGCGSEADMQDLRQFMQQADSRPAPPIPPLPEYQPYKNYNYGHTSLRTPFDRPITIEAQVRQLQNMDIRPDENRPREPLEDFRLEDLSMTGTLRLANGQINALIKDPTRRVHSLRVGNHLGQNHGRIVNITDDGLEMIEIAPNGQGGWNERPQVISILGND